MLVAILSLLTGFGVLTTTQTATAGNTCSAIPLPKACIGPAKPSTKPAQRVDVYLRNNLSVQVMVHTIWGDQTAFMAQTRLIATVAVGSPAQVYATFKYAGSTNRKVPNTPMSVITSGSKCYFTVNYAAGGVAGEWSCS
jgi:hypothetical protein